MPRWNFTTSHRAPERERNACAHAGRTRFGGESLNGFTAKTQPKLSDVHAASNRFPNRNWLPATPHPLAAKLEFGIRHVPFRLGEADVPRSVNPVAGDSPCTIIDNDKTTIDVGGPERCVEL